MGILKTSLTSHLSEMQLHQMEQKSFHQHEHVSFSHETTAHKTTFSTKQLNESHHSDRKDLDDESFHHENNFSNVHKSHHDKDSTTQFYATKGESKSAEKNRAIREKGKLYDDENNKVDNDEGDDSDCDVESHPRLTHEALLSSAGQAISNRMGLSNPSSNNGESDSLELIVANSSQLSTAPPPSSPPTALPASVQDTDADLGTSLPTSSLQADQPESEPAMKSEGPSQGVALSMGSRMDSIGENGKGNTPISGMSTSPNNVAHLPGAEENRVANFLHELQMNVAKLIKSDQGKMTFDLKNVGGNLDGIAHVSLEVIPHPFHIAVQFHTDHPEIFAFLNNQKEGLQTYLTGQFSGQVFDIKNQLTSQPSSQHFGAEGERAREDIASFNQGNRERRGSQNSG